MDPRDACEVHAGCGDAGDRESVGIPGSDAERGGVRGGAVGVGWMREKDAWGINRSRRDGGVGCSVLLSEEN